MSKKEDIFISILKFGKERVLDGVSSDDIFKLAYSKGFLSKNEFDEIKNKKVGELSLEIKLKRKRIQYIFAEAFHYEGHKDVNKPGKSTITLDSYFKYIEHVELEEARRNAREARWFSIGAIAISVGSILLSVFLSNSVKVTNPIKIEEEQFKQLQIENTGLEKKFNKLIENQQDIIKNIKMKSVEQN